jgi:hypothetical protein
MRQPNAGSFKVGHAYIARKGPPRPTQRQVRKRSLALISGLLLQLADAQARGQPIDPNHVVRLIGQYERLGREL